jgi:hypothetical protein
LLGDFKIKKKASSSGTDSCIVQINCSSGSAKLLGKVMLSALNIPKLTQGWNSPVPSAACRFRILISEWVGLSKLWRRCNKFMGKKIAFKTI